MNRSGSYAVRWVACLAAGVAALFLNPPVKQAATTRFPYLLIPQLGTQVDANDTGTFTAAPESVREIALRIPAGGSHVSYGSIHTKVNTESADIAMKSASTADGVELKLDLAAASGFLFKPGRNSVELAYKDQFGRQKYFNFLLDFGRGTLGRGVAVGPYTPDGPPEKRAGKLFAVVIGISQYQHRDQFEELRYADKDASAFIDFLKSPQGGNLDVNDARILLNRQATATNIRDALYTFLTRPQPQDTVIIYIAAHGMQDFHNIGNPYLLTWDSDRDNLGATAYLMSDLPNVYQHIIKAKRVITFADTCHSFGFSGATYEGPRPANNLMSQYLESSASQGERAVISASEVSEEAQEGEQWGGGHGVFTYFLLKGLQGDADRDHDGIVTVSELVLYLGNMVPGATHGGQNPRVTLGLTSRLPLSTLHSPKEPPKQPSHSASAQ